MAYGVSAAFRTALAKSHTVAIRVRVKSSTGTFTTLDTIGGSVSVDIDRAVRRDCSSIDVISSDGSLIPTSATSLLSPISGAELYIDRGITFSDGTTEYVPLGVFNWTTVTSAFTSAGVVITLDGLQDRAQKIIQATYSKPYAINAATAVETVLATILKRGWSNVPGTGSFPATGQTVSNRSFAAEGDSDPWTDALDLANDFGYRLYFDVNGIARLQTVGGPLSSSIVTYSSSNPLVIDISRTLDSSDTYSGVIATASGTNMLKPFRATAYDTDPASPTYYLGPFGKRIRVFSSSAINTQALANTTATAELQRTLGLVEQVSWSQIPDPSLDVGDVVTLTYNELSLNRSYRIDRIDLPLDESGLMSVTARARRLS